MTFPAAKVRYLKNTEAVLKRFKRWSPDKLLAEGVVTCDSKGRFALTVPRGSGFLVAAAPGFAERWAEVVAPTSELTLALEAGRVLAGTLQRPPQPELAHPIGLILVPTGAKPQTWGRRRHGGRTRVLDAARPPGPFSYCDAYSTEFEFRNVPRGEFDCYAFFKNEHDRPTLIATNLRPGQAGLDLEFEAPKSSTVRLWAVDAAGKGIPLLSARLHDGSELLGEVRRRHGSIEIEAWRFGDLELELHSKGLAPLLVPVRPSPGRVTDLGKVTWTNRGSLLSVKLLGSEAFPTVGVRARDPKTRRFVAAETQTPLAQRFRLSPGSVLVRVTCDRGLERAPGIVEKTVLLSGELSEVTIQLPRE
ncbi:MAG: hypothetical protein JKY65_29440 [Planctomycetes bacterium]|nr:hypothetical protein [Planctomycetota bacterium]